MSEGYLFGLHSASQNDRSEMRKERETTAKRWLHVEHVVVLWLKASLEVRLHGRSVVHVVSALNYVIRQRGYHRFWSEKGWKKGDT